MNRVQGSGQSGSKTGDVPQRDKARSRAETPAEAGATSKSVLAMPFKRAWEYLTETMIVIAPTVDGNRIYQPLQEGRVVCLDRSSGSLLWSSDSGGRITAPVAVARSESGNVIFVASEKAPQPGGSTGGLLRALDSSTGVALWSRDYPRPFSSAIASAPGWLYAGSADGSLYAFSSTDGSPVWRAQTQAPVRAGALITERVIYFGSDDGALRAVSQKTGHEIWKYQTGGPIACLPAIDDKRIYFGSGDGCLYSLDAQDGRLRWKSRTGAAIEASPVLAGDRLVVGSLDNFLYAISVSSGDRLWKRRLDNRIVFPVIIEGDAVMATPLRGDHVPVFLMSDGRRVNYYQLNRGYEIVGSPSFVEGTLLIPTDRGLVAAVTLAPAKPEVTPAGARESEPPKKPVPQPID